MNVDGIIYFERMKETVREILDDEVFLSSMEIKNISKFYDLLLHEIEYYIQDNIIEHNDPILLDTQMEKCFTNAITLYHLSNLEQRGLIESMFDIDDMETKYRLTTLGKSIAIS